jgi:AraC-like DNA-binding protein
MFNASMLDRGHFAAKFYEAMRVAGHDPEGFFGRFGLSIEQVSKHDFSFSHEAHRFFWPMLERYTNDPDIGFTLGQHLPSNRGNIFCTLHFSYPNFGSALRSNMQFSRLVSDALQWQMEQDEQGVYVQVRSPNSEIQGIRHFFEILILGLLDLYKELTNDIFQPSQIQFACPAPADLGKRREVYGCEVLFGCDEHRVYFPPSMLEIAFAMPDESLMKAHQEYARSVLRKIEDADFLQLTQQVITEMLSLGDITLEQVSQRLSLTTAELKYRLEKMNTHFLKEREACRRRFVFSKLKENQASITDIALQAGFSEPSTFYRAFKRWSDGETPVAFRARHFANPAL